MIYKDYLNDRLCGSLRKSLRPLRLSFLPLRAQRIRRESSEVYVSILKTQAAEFRLDFIRLSGN
jgi:hypothetical protein